MQKYNNIDKIQNTKFRDINHNENTKILTDKINENVGHKKRGLTT